MLPLAAMLAQQVVFLYGSLASRATYSWQKSGKLIAQAASQLTKWPIDHPSLLRIDALPCRR
jgi:hypothetical protein